MGADKRDAGWHNLTQWSHTRCAGVCDDNIGMCYCPPDTKYGRREAADPKLPPIQAGRPLSMCSPSADKDGKKVEWGVTPYEDIFGPGGWCNADQPKFTCPCRLDGLSGTLCDEPIEQTCVNQCSGHGDCNQGFCKCHKGWYGVDCGLRRKGVYLTDGDQVTSKPWMQGVITPAVAPEDPPMTPYRRRPYVYVYDMKSDFSTDLWQYRIEARHCVYRQFEARNQSRWSGYIGYMTEHVLHELFLTSEHRTLNPEEADYFYVPISLACMFEIYGWNAIPRWPAEVHGTRSYGAAMMQLEAMKWIAETFPYFKRNGGKDHIWYNPHDEGACYVWKDIWPGVMLSHWGRMDMPHASQTGYGADNYSLPVEHKDQPLNWLDQTSKAHPCFDPKKDLVIPAFKPPSAYRESPYMGSKVGQKRDTLASFVGDLRMEPGRDPGCAYSRCLRQRIYNMSIEGKWKETHNILYGDRHVLTKGIDYSKQLASSTFCFVLPGDGFSQRFEDAALHGCIPVIIMDQVQAIFESILDVASISIRIPEAEISKIPEILKAVPADKIAKMQEGISRTWQRFRYIKLKMIIEDARKVLAGHVSANDGSAPKNLGAAYSVSKQDDAFATIMQWLYSRIPDATGKPLAPTQAAVLPAASGGATGAAATA
ncbi:hypothetical protein HYH03_013205 [Edaphochlamys debaryana]|uniref:Exostosin GT47 domain-containing protein n=1 Tax=Edaphochlamys debaryana TaxID=47281 RepID=A0A835XTY4_9CHLO|nr:hypothetical protein HYH03_013205 [Edaphochlamys debaryana]|eukprot:KAG2488211.1 hypothetical protein HYH03_013205 [Edaphochlamys debaryana]